MDNTTDVATGNGDAFMKTVFDGITAHLGTTTWLAALAVVCGVIAVIKFANRGSSGLLGKIGRG